MNMYRISNYSHKRIFKLKPTKEIVQFLKKFNNVAQFNEYSTTACFKNAKEIRKEFLDYFINDLNHTFIPSSPIVPWCDPSVSFINSGMNQFKGIFLGYHDPPTSKAVNFQKCIRVGGKHNDIDDVGHDSYHHTFFEMLGNWSFGAYNKEEACKYSWDLLTQIFGIDENALYVTYFGGDDSLDMKPDLECLNIWLSLGVPKNRIFSSGMEKNFWEMNLNGPCGPCTEIHIDKRLQTIDKIPNEMRSQMNLTELWNIVFIECQRLKDGSIVPLEKQYIDTGMGFERLVATCQGKKSNYDTDLFQPLFHAIHRKTNARMYEGKFGIDDKNNIDTGYRILADHSRMITVALADGMIPEKNHKLRKIIRKAIIIGKETFRDKKLLSALTDHVAESLGDTYPEIPKNLKRIQAIIEYETDLFLSLCASSREQWQNLVQFKPSLAAISDPFTPGLIPAYQELQWIRQQNPNLSVIPAEFVFKMYDTYGLDIDTIEELATIDGLVRDKEGFNEYLDAVKFKSKVKGNQNKGVNISSASIDVLEKSNVPKTDDSYKYKYSFSNGKYRFTPLNCKIVGFIVNGETFSDGTIKLDNEAINSNKISIIFDKTSFYAPEGGQLSDKGSIRIKDETFNVTETYKLNGYVIHPITIHHLQDKDVNMDVCVGDNVIIEIDEKHRSQLMRNHTATHLLNAALKKVFPAIAQRGSLVENNHLIFKFNTFGTKILPEHLSEIEKLVNDCINNKVPVKSKSVDIFQFMAENDLLLIPGEVYPDNGLRIIEIMGCDLQSKEACCGTHVHNTSILNKFSIIESTSKSSTQIIKAVTGTSADKSSTLKTEKRSKASHGYLVNVHSEEEKKQIILSIIKSEMTNAVKSRTCPFIVHCINSDDIEAESIPLQIAAEYCTDFPIFLIAMSRRKIRMRCVVPEEYQSPSFNARLWMKEISKYLPIKIGSFEDEDDLTIIHTKILKAARDQIPLLVEKTIKNAKLFASEHIKEGKHVDHNMQNIKIM